MIITHVLSSFGLGGQERVALDLARLQQADGHTVHVVSLAPPPEGPLGETFRSVGAETHELPKRGAGFDTSLVARLSVFFRRHHVDVVHTHNPQPLIYAAPAARLAGARCIHSKHGKNPVSPRRRWLIRGAAACVDAYVAVAPTTARVALVNRECAPDKLQVVHNGVDVERFQRDQEARRQVRAELGIPEQAWVVGTVGRLAPEKDQALLIRGSWPLLDEGHHLVVVGDGPEREALEAAARGEKRPFIHLTGPRSDVARLLSGFDVFALTSQTEGLPLVIPEAMSASLPVVSTAVGGIPDVLSPERTGLLVPAGDEVQLRAALQRLADAPDWARELGARAQEVALAQYSRRRMADAYAALYEAALARRSGKTPVAVSTAA